MVAAAETSEALERVRGKLKGELWNLRFRRYATVRGAEDERFRMAMQECCRQDILFWINAFVWTYDPRPQGHSSFARWSKVPMITYPYQDKAVGKLVKAVGQGHDLLIEKSRDMGASWLCLLVILWFWIFEPLLSFLLGSRTQEYVDKRGNPKCLFWKLLFALEWLPAWLVPHFDKVKNHLLNLDDGAVIDGEATTSEFSRGDRRTAELLDEFAACDVGDEMLSSTRDATTCRLVNSTHQGTATAYYRMTLGSIQKLRMHWSDHPNKNRGLYTKRGTDWVFIDREYWAQYDDPDAVARELDEKIHRRGVPLDDGKLRSPWYAHECERAVSAFEIAQELDIDSTGSSRQFFHPPVIEEYIKNHCCAPYRIGEIKFDEETLSPTGWRDDPHGRFKLWMQLDGNGFPMGEGHDSLGVDVSAGTGASNSCLSAINSTSLEKTLEFADPLIGEEEFGRLAVATARWLGNATIIWEQSGPGRPFGRAVLDADYRNIYYQRDEQKVLPKMTDIPGYVPTRKNKRDVLSAYRRALEIQTIINRSEISLREALHFVHLPDGSVEHQQARGNPDPSGASSNHGDRVIADALAWKIVRVRPTVIAKRRPDPCPVGSFAWRRKVARQEERRKSMWTA